MNNLIKKINELFDSIDCKSLVLLKTSEKDKEVDNGCGMEFNLSEYALIYSGDIYSRQNHSRICNFEQNNNINIAYFDIEGIKDLEAFINELKEIDNYNVIYKRII